MKQHQLIILPNNISLTVPDGQNLLEILRKEGLHLDAPCGGNGTCGKCKVLICEQEQLACQTYIYADTVVKLPIQNQVSILTNGLSVQIRPDEAHTYSLAFDIGTTTIVAYLLNGENGTLLAQASCLNPQTAFGADVISRIQYALNDGNNELKTVACQALTALTEETAQKAGINTFDISLAVIVGNTAMHHLLLDLDPRPLTLPPYMPATTDAQEFPVENFIPISSNGLVRVLPNIAGFVGADTVGCLVATRFDQLEKLTLMIDIGTNGEMVLGNCQNILACSTAAGPAFEGAKISCGMRGTIGAIDHVWLEDGEICWHTIGETIPVGLCGSGLLDLIAILLEIKELDETGFLVNAKEYRLGNTSVILTQKDIREVQLAKAAIRAGIELMAEKMQVKIDDIQTVYLAGAFGNYMNPSSACKIGMIPPCLESRILGIGNAAGEGAKLCALNKQEFIYSKNLSARTEFVELATCPQFQDRYVDALMFSEDNE